jgi:hypothetical protein
MIVTSGRTIDSNDRMLTQLFHQPHRFHRMDIHAPRCLNMGGDIIVRNDHEKAQYDWDRRWCRVIGGGALVASVVASGPCGATANGVTR